MTTAKISLLTILLISLLVPVSLIAENQEENTKFKTDVFETSMINTDFRRDV